MRAAVKADPSAFRAAQMPPMVNPTLTAAKPGLYYVDRQTWQLNCPARHLAFQVKVLLKSLQVALKRIGNVLSSPENAKRVLREVCILRRLHHPNIISISNAFLTPSATGPLVYRNGKFVNTSLDIYLALEYCEAGDLFMMRGQLPETDAQQLMWQLLEAVKYLHANSVWHRDIKSSNVLVTVQDGRRIAKVADFGSARSAITPSSHDDAGVLDSSCHSSLSGNPHGVISAAGALTSPATMHNSESMQADLDTSDQPLKAQPSGGPTGGYQQPLTRVVSTPCYRAPEVVLSRGGYCSAIDMWSVGCVFGELLHRVYRLHQSAIPNLQVAPVFAVTGLPVTPTDGDCFEGHVGNASTHAELEALFKVIGTPAWACIEGVANPRWRRYLFRIRGRAPTLFRRFGMAGEPAVDLLTRLLTFDPSRRCSAEEAMVHEFFDQLKLTQMMSEHDLGRYDDDEESDCIAAAACTAGKTAAAHVNSARPPSASLNGLHSCSEQRSVSPPPAGMMDVDAPSGGMVSRPGSNGQHLGVPCSIASGPTSPTAKRTCTRSLSQPSRVPSQSPRFHEITDAAAALAALEVELAVLFAPGSADGTERLREMLQRECDELAHQEAEQLQEYQQAVLAAAQSEPQPPGQQLTQPLSSGEGFSPRYQPGTGVVSGSSFSTAGGSSFGASSLPSEVVTSGGSQSCGSHPSGIPCAAGAHAAGIMSGGGALLSPANFYGAARTAHDHLRRFSPLPRRDSLPKLDPGQHIDASVAGRERITHCADAETAHLLPEKHLKAGRHGEWVHVATPAGPKAGPQWGVTLLPPGTDPDLSPAMMDIIRSQHAR